MKVQQVKLYLLDEYRKTREQRSTSMKEWSND